MTPPDLEEMSREELLRELRKLQAAVRKFGATADRADRESLIHDLHVHEAELEIQNRELREARERLEEVSSRFTELYDFAPVGYCTLGPQGHIREINLAGATILGAPREKLLGSLFSAVAPLADMRTFLDHLSRCKTEQAQVTSELSLLLGDRGSRVLQMISAPVRDASGSTTAYRTIFKDISETKDLENKLRLLSEAGAVLSSSLEYKTTVQTAAHLVVPALADLCVIDVLGDSGKIDRPVVLFADPKKQQSLAEGLTQFAERPGWHPLHARVLESGKPILLPEVAAELRDRIAYDDQHARILRAADIRSFLIVPLSARGQTLGALTLATAESNRRYSPLDLRLAQDLASRAAMAIDNARLYKEQAALRRRFEVLDRVSTHLSQKLADDSNAPMEEILQEILDQARLVCDAEYAAVGFGEDLDRPFHPWVFSGLEPSLARAMGRFPSPTGVLGEVIHTGHSLRLRDLRNHPGFRGYPPHHPQMRSFLGVVISHGGRQFGHLYLTNKRSAEEFTKDDQDTVEMLAQRVGNALEIAHLTRQLRASVSARDSLLAIVSHDLRSPLHAIQLCAELATVEYRKEDRRKSRKWFDSILRSCQAMHRLIEDLLQAATVEAGTFTVEPTRAEVAPLIEQSLEAHGALAAAKSVQLQQDVPAGLPPVHCDCGRVLQVLSNLIGNAIKFVPAGSAILVRAEAQTRDILFSVADKGPGIAEKDLPQLFDRYWKGTTKGGKGAGLGLFIAKGIVAAHGGRLWVESQVGVGSTFYFTIPIAQSGEPNERCAAR